MSNEVSQKPLALVTGASTGIGRHLAQEFAEHGFDLVVVARHADLDQAATELRATGVRVDAYHIDLGEPDGVAKLVEALAGRSPDVAALNAGFGVAGDFTRETKLDDELAIIDLNVKSTVRLAKHVLRSMVQQGYGRVLFTSSVVGVMPSPLQAVYAASKAFVHSFAESVRNELDDTKVSVTALMPNATDTEFFESAGYEGTRVKRMKKDDPAEVARQGFEALMAGKDHVVGGGLGSKLMVAMNKFMTESGKAIIPRKLGEKSAS